MMDWETYARPPKDLLWKAVLRRRSLLWVGFSYGLDDARTESIALAALDVLFDKEMCIRWPAV